MRSIRFVLVVVVLLLLSFSLPAKPAKHTAAYLSMDRKIDIIEANALRPPSQPQNTDLTQDELNAYFAEGGVEMPKGVESAKFELRPGVVHATSTVNFDTLAEGHTGNNPIFSALFTGTHDIEAQAQASGAQGQGTIAVDWVKLDGVQIPRSALEYLLNHYVKPKYPNAGMTTRFTLPARIDMAAVSESKVTLTQK